MANPDLEGYEILESDHLLDKHNNDALRMSAGRSATKWQGKIVGYKLS